MNYIFVSFIISIIMYFDLLIQKKEDLFERLKKFINFFRIPKNINKLFILKILKESMKNKLLEIKDKITGNVTCIENEKKYISSKYIISYNIKGKNYKFIVKHEKGPPRIFLITDEDKNDITDLVMPYMGPEYNFHDIAYTPSFFDKSEINFELFDGTIKTFKNEEILIPFED